MKNDYLQGIFFEQEDAEQKPAEKRRPVRNLFSRAFGELAPHKTVDAKQTIEDIRTNPTSTREAELNELLQRFRHR